MSTLTSGDAVAMAGALSREADIVRRGGDIEAAGQIRRRATRFRILSRRLIQQTRDRAARLGTIPPYPQESATCA